MRGREFILAKSIFCRAFSLKARVLVLALLVTSVEAQTKSTGPGAGPLSRQVINVTDYFPIDFAKDGSISYQPAIQRAVDDAVKLRCDIVFPPGTYRIDDPAGVQIGSKVTLHMYGAKFVVSEHCEQDGQVFLGDAVHDVQFFGGEIVGRNDRWPAGVNIAGIRLNGACQRIRIRDMHLHGLSSNGIGIFATAEQPARDVWVTDTIVQNCCNQYGDYTAPAGELRGPEKGSTRQDQGLIACYFVYDFSVRGCRFEDSRSDGTHFFRCRAGQFVDNKVYRAKMGGYFLESCEQVLAANNVIADNGSRGVTIERGSVRCTLQGNTIEGSGREGLWIPDCRQCVVTGNLFLLNGRKPNTPRQVWNANITINEAAANDRSNQWTPGTQDYLIAHNTIETDDSQVAAIRVVGSPRLRQINIKDNMLLGPNRRIAIEGEPQDQVRLAGNNHAP